MQIGRASREFSVSEILILQHAHVCRFVRKHIARQVEKPRKMQSMGRREIPREARLRYLWKLKSLPDKYSRETTYETPKFNLEFD